MIRIAYVFTLLFRHYFLTTVIISIKSVFIMMSFICVLIPITKTFLVYDGSPLYLFRDAWMSIFRFAWRMSKDSIIPWFVNIWFLTCYQRRENDLFRSCVDSVSAWWRISIFFSFSSKSSYQFKDLFTRREGATANRVSNALRIVYMRDRVPRLPGVPCVYLPRAPF